jgi:tRNA U34 2-thiouridine synthase MnmA/TrmU
MRKCGAEHGYNFNSHARQFQKSDFGRFETIVVMDNENYRAITSMASCQADKDKVVRMADFLTHHREYPTVPDPYLGEKPGDVIEMETGKRIGTHKGLWFHTIGQRKGLGFGGGPWFVIKKDVEKNILYVSHGYDPQTAYKKDFPLQDFHFLTREVAMQKVTFKIRHTPEYHPATIEKLEDGRWMIHSEEAIHGVAPGQFCVVYDENHHRCYGSGEITV